MCDIQIEDYILQGIELETILKNEEFIIQRHIQMEGQQQINQQNDEDSQYSSQKKNSSQTYIHNQTPVHHSQSIQRRTVKSKSQKSSPRSVIYIEETDILYNDQLNIGLSLKQQTMKKRRIKSEKCNLNCQNNENNQQNIKKFTTSIKNRDQFYDFQNVSNDQQGISTIHSFKHQKLQKISKSQISKNKKLNSHSKKLIFQQEYENESQKNNRNTKSFSKNQHQNDFFCLNDKLNSNEALQIQEECGVQESESSVLSQSEKSSKKTCYNRQKMKNLKKINSPKSQLLSSNGKRKNSISEFFNFQMEDDFIKQQHYEAEEGENEEIEEHMDRLNQMIQIMANNMQIDVVQDNQEIDSLKSTYKNHVLETFKYQQNKKKSEDNIFNFNNISYQNTTNNNMNDEYNFKDILEQEILQQDVQDMQSKLEDAEIRMEKMSLMIEGLKEENQNLKEKILNSQKKRDKQFIFENEEIQIKLLIKEIGSDIIYQLYSCKNELDKVKIALKYVVDLQKKNYLKNPIVEDDYQSVSSRLTHQSIIDQLEETQGFSPVNKTLTKILFPATFQQNNQSFHRKMSGSCKSLTSIYQQEDSLVLDEYIQQQQKQSQQKQNELNEELMTQKYKIQERKINNELNQSKIPTPKHKKTQSFSSIVSQFAKKMNQNQEKQFTENTTKQNNNYQKELKPPISIMKGQKGNLLLSEAFGGLTPLSGSKFISNFNEISSASQKQQLLDYNYKQIMTTQSTNSHKTTTQSALGDFCDNQQSDNRFLISEQSVQDEFSEKKLKQSLQDFNIEIKEF